MTYAQLITDLKNRVGPGVEVDDNGLGVWINDAYMQVLDAVSEINPDYFTKSATADTVDGTQEYELPDDFERAIMVTMTLDGVTYRPKPLDTINRIPIFEGADPNNGFSLANPVYYIVGSSIGFLPIPTETAQENIRLWYVYTPDTLSADSDVPAFPAKYHSLINLAAYAIYLDQNDEHVAAENIRRRFDKRLEQMVDSMSQNQIDEPKSVQINDYSGLYYDEFDY